MAHRPIDEWSQGEHIEYMKQLESLGTAILAAYTADPHGFTIKGRMVEHRGKIFYQFLITIGNSAADMAIDPLQPAGKTDNFIDAVYMTIERTHAMKLIRCQDILAKHATDHELQPVFKDHYEKREDFPGFYTLLGFINTHNN